MSKYNGSMEQSLFSQMMEDITVTNENFDLVEWNNVKKIIFKDCTKPLTNFINIHFSGTITRVEFHETMIPHNLVLILQCSTFLQEITFIRVKVRGPIPCFGKIICESLISITFVGDSKVKTLTKNEMKIIKFLNDWTIFRSTVTLNFLVPVKVGGRVERTERISVEPPPCCQLTGDSTHTKSVTKFLAEHDSWGKQVKSASQMTPEAV